jgi:drug/metabolite transporter (DMT)-like permease
MLLLLIASLVWAFSFGLIGNRLAGLDPSVVAVARLTLSLLVFAPFVRRAGVGMATALRLLLLGGVQFGLMYVLYIAAFGHLPSHLVALFTILTPLYVAILAHLGHPRRALRPLLAALLAVAGAALVSWRTPAGGRFWTGFALVQGSNFCFALGQLGYRRLMRRTEGVGDTHAMAWMYAGAVAAALPFAVRGWRAGGFAPDWSQWAVLGYLGIVASGISFWLWNRGARGVRVATLAVMNNAKIPLAVAVSLLIFREQTDGWRLAAAAAVMLLALVVGETGARNAVSGEVERG